MSKGLFIFIGGFLGLVFLMATGSIIYFKQISKLNKNAKRFEVLRKLGFSAVSQIDEHRSKATAVYVWFAFSNWYLAQSICAEGHYKPNQ